MDAYETQCEIERLVQKIVDSENAETERANINKNQSDNNYNLWIIELNKFHWKEFIFGCMISPAALFIFYMIVYAISHSR